MSIVLILFKGINEALPSLLLFKKLIHSAAVLSSSTTMFCILLPAVISKARAYFLLTWPSSATVPRTPLNFFLFSRIERMASLVEMPACTLILLAFNLACFSWNSVSFFLAFDNWEAKLLSVSRSWFRRSVAFLKLVFWFCNSVSWSLLLCSTSWTFLILSSILCNWNSNLSFSRRSSCCFWRICWTSSCFCSMIFSFSSMSLSMSTEDSMSCFLRNSAMRISTSCRSRVLVRIAFWVSCFFWVIVDAFWSSSLSSSLNWSFRCWILLISSFKVEFLVLSLAMWILRSSISLCTFNCSFSPFCSISWLIVVISVLFWMIFSLRMVLFASTSLILVWCWAISSSYFCLISSRSMIWKLMWVALRLFILSNVSL